MVSSISRAARQDTFDFRKMHFPGRFGRVLIPRASGADYGTNKSTRLACMCARSELARALCIVAAAARDGHCREMAVVGARMLL